MWMHQFFFERNAGIGPPTKIIRTSQCILEAPAFAASRWYLTVVDELVEIEQGVKDRCVSTGLDRFLPLVVRARMPA
jgi:hypothetical protein